MRRGCLFHLYERSSLVPRRTEVRLRGGAFLVQTCAGNNVALVVLGRWARLDFLPPSPRARLPCPASESLLARGFFVCKASTACGFVNFVNLTSRKRLSR